MDSMRAFREVIDFIARGMTPSEVITFKLSAEARARVWSLIEQEKSKGLSPDEKLELDQYMQLEHIMRLAKARARQFLASE